VVVPSLTRTLSASLAALAAILLAVGCGDDARVLDRTELRQLIVMEFTEQLGLPVSDVSCPEIRDPEVGTTFQCTAVIDEQTLRVDGVVTDAEEGSVDVENADAVLRVAFLEDVIGRDFTEQLGVGVTVDCGDTEVIVAAPGLELDCVAVDEDGNEGTVVVEVLDREGNVAYELV
jgi:hypothetical protein